MNHYKQWLHLYPTDNFFVCNIPCNHLIVVQFGSSSRWSKTIGLLKSYMQLFSWFGTLSRWWFDLSMSYYMELWWLRISWGYFCSVSRCRVNCYLVVQMTRHWVQFANTQMNNLISWQTNIHIRSLIYNLLDRLLLLITAPYGKMK